MTEKQIEALRESQDCRPIGHWMRCNFTIRSGRKVEPKGDYIWFPIKGRKTKQKEAEKEIAPATREKVGQGNSN